MSYRDTLDTRLAELMGFPEISDEEGQKLLEEAHEYTRRFKAYNLATDAAKRLQSQASPLTVLSELKEQSQALLSTSTFLVQSVGDFIEEYIDSFGESGRYCVPTPFAGLNEALGGGFHGGGLSRISAPPGHGKTELALTCAEYAAASGVLTIYISMEMSKEELVDRGVARIGGINSRHLRSKSSLPDALKGGIEDALDKYMQVYSNTLHFVEGSYDTTPYVIASYIAHIRQQHGMSKDSPFLVVIDYVQLLNTGNEKIDSAPNETVKISELAVMEKRLARDNNVTVLSISDITKVEQAKADTESGLSLNSLRGSNRLGHSADCVIFLYSEQSFGEEGKAEHDPWMVYSENLKKGNAQHPMLERLEKARKLYPLGGEPVTAYARIELGKNRWGRKGVQIPLVYQKAYHRMFEIQ